MNDTPHYGKELILDIWDAHPETFTRRNIEGFMQRLCDRIKMKRADLHFWDYEGEPAAYELAPDHLKGVSAVQFIETSNVTIHTLDVLCQVYINVFSCKAFDVETVKKIALEFFGGRIVNDHTIGRR